MKRFVTLAEYQKMTGLSYPTVKYCCDTGQLKAIKTEAGHWKIDISDNGPRETAAIIERLDAQGKLLQTLAAHLGAV